MWIISMSYSPSGLTSWGLGRLGSGKIKITG